MLEETLWLSDGGMRNVKHLIADISVASLRPLIRKALEKVLGHQFEKASAATIHDATWRRYAELHSTLPAEPTVGAQVMVHLATITLSLFEVLLAQGQTEAEARSLTSKATWEVYQRICDLPWAVTPLGTRSRLERVERAMKLFMRFPYAAPGYEMAFVEVGPDCVGFDVRRCPVAEFFAARGQSELCKQAFCDLDYPLAERWGVRLTRERQISTGDPQCEFRFAADDHGSAED